MDRLLHPDGLEVGYIPNSLAPLCRPEAEVVALLATGTGRHPLALQQGQGQLAQRRVRQGIVEPGYVMDGEPDVLRGRAHLPLPGQAVQGSIHTRRWAACDGPLTTASEGFRDSRELRSPEGTGPELDPCGHLWHRLPHQPLKFLMADARRRWRGHSGLFGDQGQAGCFGFSLGATPPCGGYGTMSATDSTLLVTMLLPPVVPGS